MTPREITAKEYAKSSAWTSDRVVLVEFARDVSMSGRVAREPVVEINTFLGYNASMTPESVADLAKRLQWAADNAPRLTPTSGSVFYAL